MKFIELYSGDKLKAKQTTLNNLDIVSFTSKFPKELEGDVRFFGTINIFNVTNWIHSRVTNAKIYPDARTKGDNFWVKWVEVDIRNII